MVVRRSVTEGEEALTPQELEILRRAQQGARGPLSPRLLDLLPVPQSIRPAPPVQVAPRATLPGGVQLRGDALPRALAEPGRLPTQIPLPQSRRVQSPTLSTAQAGAEGLAEGARQGFTYQAMVAPGQARQAVEADVLRRARQAQSQRERDREALRQPTQGLSAPAVMPEAEEPPMSWTEAVGEIGADLRAGRTEGMAQGAARALGEGLGGVALDPLGDVLFLGAGQAAGRALQRAARQAQPPAPPTQGALEAERALTEATGFDPLARLAPVAEPTAPALRVPGARQVGAAARSLAETAGEIGQGFAQQAVNIGGRTARPGVLGPVSRRRPEGTLADPLTPRATQGPDLPLAGRAFNAANFGAGLTRETQDRLRDAVANAAEELAERGQGSGARISQRETINEAAELGLEGVLDLERNVQRGAGLSRVELTAANRVMRELGEQIGELNGRAFAEASPAAREALQGQARELGEQFRRVAQVAGYGRSEAGRALNMLALGPRDPFDAARVVTQARSLAGRDLSPAVEQVLVDMAGEGRRLVDAAEAARQAARQADEIEGAIPDAVRQVEEGPVPSPDDVARSVSDLAQARQRESAARLALQAIRERERQAVKAGRMADKNAARAEAATARAEAAKQAAAAAIAAAEARRAEAVLAAQEAKAAGRQARQAESAAARAEGKAASAADELAAARDAMAAAEARRNAAEQAVKDAKEAQRQARQAEKAAGRAEGRAAGAADAIEDANVRRVTAEAMLAEAQKQIDEAADAIRRAKEAEKAANAAQRKAARMEAKAAGAREAEQAAKEAEQAAREKQAELLQQLNELEKTPFFKGLTAFMQANLLSGVGTPLRGMVGNAANMGFEGAAKVPAAGLDMLLSLGTKDRSVLATPATLDRWAASARKGFTEGWQAAKETMVFGATLDELSKMDQARSIYLGDNPAQRMLAGYINTVLNVQSAADKPFRLYAMHRRLDELARIDAGKQAKAQGLNKRQRAELEANLRENPTKEMMLDAMTVAEEAVFANRTWLATAVQGGMAKAFREAKKQGSMGELSASMAEALARFFIPFINVPSAVFSRTVQSTPLGLAEALLRVGMGVAKGMTREEQRKASMAFGRGTMGTGLMALGYYLYSQGMMTPAYDPQQAETYRATERTWGALRIPGLSENWLPIAFVAPAGPLLALGATLAAMEGKSAGDLALAVPGAAASVVAQMPALSGLQALTESARPGGGGLTALGERSIADLPYRLTPMAATLRDVAALTDPSGQRPYTRGDDIAQTASRRFQAGIPGLRAGLPRENLGLGDVAQAPSGLLGGQLSPFRSAPALEGAARNRPDVRAVLASGVNLPPRDKSISGSAAAEALGFRRGAVPAGLKIDLTADEQNELHGLAGRFRQATVGALARQGMAQDPAAIKKAIEEADKAALQAFAVQRREAMLGRLGLAAGKGAAPKPARPVGR